MTGWIVPYENWHGCGNIRTKFNNDYFCEETFNSINHISRV